MSLSDRCLNNCVNVSDRLTRGVVLLRPIDTGRTMYMLFYVVCWNKLLIAVFRVFKEGKIIIFLNLASK